MSESAEITVLKSLGIDIDALVAQAVAGAVQVAVKGAVKRELRVSLNEGEDAQKWGAVTISKAGSNGRYFPKVGIREGDLDFVIAELTAARNALAS